MKMIKNIMFGLCFLVIVLVSGCTEDIPPESQTITEEDLPIDLSPFLDAGCTSHPGYDFAAFRLDCDAAKVQDFARCEFYEVKHSFAGFGVPFLQCYTVEHPSPGTPFPSLGFFNLQYVFYDEGTFSFVETREELTALFTPIENPSSALSYVAAATTSFLPSEMPEDWLRRSSAPDSFVVTRDDGYVVRLYDSAGGLSEGGTDYTVYAIDYFVTEDGEVSEIERRKIGTIENNVIVEEQGILLIKSLPEYAAAVAAHGEEQVGAAALDRHQEGIDYVGENHDEFRTEFMPVIDDGFLPTSGCIIVLQAGDEGFVYQLDKDFNIVHRVSLATFQEGEKRVDAETMEWFWDSLK
jgi:hypothetical protein